MDGPSSDAENETIIATTTYITLSGTHITESEVFGSSSSASSLSSKEPEQPHQHHQHQNKSSILYQKELPDTLTEIKIAVEKDVEENVAGIIETHASSPRDASATIASDLAYCNVQTIIMDPIMAERQHLERNATSSANATMATTPINPSSRTRGRRFDPDPDTSPNRLRLILRRIGRRFMICLQVNKDCIFCLMFFLAFVLCASMLTVFFYNAMTTLNAQTFQYPVMSTGRIYYL